MTDDMHIRLALGSDLRRVRELVQRAYRGEPARQGWTHEADLLDGQRIDEKMLAELLLDPDQQLLLVALEHDAIVGCVHLARINGSAAYLGLLTIAPELQGSGRAKRLLLAAEHLATERFGASLIEMTVIGQRVELIDYYQRRGYLLTGERRPFPHGDERFGVARRGNLSFVVLRKMLQPA